MEAHTVEVDGVRMRWIERGEGTPVVLVHGLPTSPALFRRVMDEVRGARLFAWEMVGYGESIPSGRDRDISVARQARYLLAWMKAIGIPRAVLVGHDLGGGVVQIAAVRAPEQCAGLVLVDSIAYDAWPVPIVRAARAIAPIVARTPMRALRLVLGRVLSLGHDVPSVARESMELHLRAYAKHDGARALIRQLASLDTRDTLAVADELAKLRRVPCRVVWGAADPFLKLRWGVRLARDLGCELTSIEGASHFLPEDHPDAVASAIRDVVDRVERAARESTPRIHN